MICDAECVPLQQQCRRDIFFHRRVGIVLCMDIIILRFSETAV